MEYAQLQDFVIVLIAICALIAAVSGACAAVVKFWRYAHKDSEANARRIDDHEKRITYLEGCCEEVHGKLKSDWEWQQAADEKSELVLLSIKQLLKHSIDGNDTQGLKDMEDEIDRYLIKHQKG